MAKYGKYKLGYFSVEAKHSWHDAHWEEDLQKAIKETVNDELKNIAQIEHSRHRCFDNFIVNILRTAYCMFPKNVYQCRKSH